MKRNLKGYSGNFLFFLNIFILFLIVFENQLFIPFWLQPVGRMHPLILHFPIVLLLLSMVMEFFRFKTSYQGQEFYLTFTSNLLFVGVISSGVTVIMGLFLSQEGGYDPTALFWHKWAGISVFFISSIVYSARDSSWYRARVAKAGAVSTILFLIFAGHFGASLTHGDDFIWQPVMSAPQVVVSVDDAFAFDHVIKPIVEDKCISCHNPDKIKGRLLLTDSASIMKGGKSGKLLVPGQPEASLLLKRLGLPLEDKKHMPPSGKPQLTSHEQTVLYAWIKAGAPFHTRIATMEATDTFRVAAASFLQGDAPQEVFTFSAAEPEILQRLNSNYRIVVPVAKHSPALAVNVYNKSTYSSKTLDDLKEVSDQVIYLHLSKMPVSNADVKYIGRFQNLRKLNLNFTNINGGALKELVPLRELKQLTLSGTDVSYADLAQYLPLLPALESVALWDTNISESQIKQLQESFPRIEFLGAMAEAVKTPIKLNPPRLKNTSRVFADKIAVQLFHPVNGVEIRFTTDGTEPDSITSKVFDGKTSFMSSVAIKARAFKNGWLSSDVAELQVYRSGIKPDTAILLTPLNRVHKANGAKTFFDHELGSFNANSPAWANNWAGFNKNDMELLLRFNEPRRVSSVSMNTLIEPETSIFPPASIEIWAGQREDQLQMISRTNPHLPATYSKPFIRLIDCRFDAHEVSFLKIIAKPVMLLPEWHRRKNKPALLLVDEILIN